MPEPSPSPLPVPWPVPAPPPAPEPWLSASPRPASIVPSRSRGAAAAVTTGATMTFDGNGSGSRSTGAGGGADGRRHGGQFLRRLLAPRCRDDRLRRHRGHGQPRPLRAAPLNLRRRQRIAQATAPATAAGPWRHQEHEARFLAWCVNRRALRGARRQHEQRGEDRPMDERRCEGGEARPAFAEGGSGSIVEESAGLRSRLPRPWRSPAARAPRAARRRRQCSACPERSAACRR